MTRIAVAIVNYNTIGHLRDYLATARAAGATEMVLKDNGSTDGSVEMVEREFSEVRVLDSRDNPGYGAASNQAIAVCRAPYVLLLNSDILLDPNALDVLVEHLDAHPRAAIVGPRLQNTRRLRSVTVSDPDTRRPTILLTGAAGQVGWELRRSLAPLGHVVALGRSELDLTRHERIAEIVEAVAPAAMVHFSTDYVFDGTKTTAYLEDDAPAPLGVYGSSKLAGDQAVIGAGIPYLVLRTSWVYAARGRNFLRTMLRLAHERTELAVVADQFGAPTPARLIADVTAQLLGHGRDPTGFRFPSRLNGVYNVTARGVASWYDLATAILALDPRRERQTVRHIRPITTAEYPTPARRPTNSLLDLGKLERTLGIRMPEWEAQLETVMRELPMQELA
ncbi:MAG: sugar nucleotide-binding protein [Gemmatimonadaceae bacterium]